jgi:hypothetical protein
MLNKIVFGLCILNLIGGIVAHNLSAACGWGVAAIAQWELITHAI